MKEKEKYHLLLLDKTEITNEKCIVKMISEKNRKYNSNVRITKIEDYGVSSSRN